MSEADVSEVAWLIPLEDHAVEGAPAGSLLSVFPGLTIGRGEFNHVHAREVSRQHARVVRLNGAWCLEDLQSTNGTFVGGVRVQRGPAVLTAGCQVRCAATTFRFEVAPTTPTAFPLEEQLRARPDDDAPWTVAADRWLEQDLRWGARIGARAVGFPAEDALLNAATRCRGLEVEWRLGFARRASIRPACVRAGLSPEVVLNALLTHPLSRFLEQLQLDGLRLFDLRDEQDRDREDASAGFHALLRRWLPPGLSRLEVGVARLGTEGALEQVSVPLGRARPELRQQFWLHGTMRLDPGGEVSPVFGAQLDCQGLVRCSFEQLRGGTHALRVLDEVAVRIGEVNGGRGMWWFPGEELSVKGTTLRFSEHTQTLLVVPAR